MTSRFLSQTSGQGAKPLAKLFILILCSFALLFADGRFALIQTIRTTIITALYPVQTAANVPGDLFKKVKIFFVSQTEVQKENARLQFENAQLTAQIYNQNVLDKTLSELKVLGATQKTDMAVVTIAEVLVSNQSPFSNKINLTKGSKDKVALGQAVVDANGLIGQVSYVSPFISEVTLLISNKQITPVMIERTGDRALLYGSGNGVELRYLPTEVDLKAGDRLVTSGSDGIYIPGIPVAKVLEAKKSIASPFYKVKSVPLSGIRRSRYLFILEKDSLSKEVAEALAERNAENTPPTRGRAR